MHNKIMFSIRYKLHVLGKLKIVEHRKKTIKIRKYKTISSPKKTTHYVLRWFHLPRTHDAQ